MVAPLALMGVAGLLGGLAARPHVQNYDARVRGRYADSVYGNLLEDGSSDDIYAAGIRGGLLGAGDMMDLQQRQLEANRSYQLGLGNLALGQGRLALDRQAYGDAAMSADLATIPTVDGPIDMNTAWDVLVNMESGGNPNAVSPKGAAGVAQIMPANVAPWAREMGLAQPGETDAAIIARYRSDPAFQEQLGKAKFGQYVEQHGLTDAFARWHSGVSLEQAVREGRHDGDPSTGQGMYTRDYVQRNMNAYEHRLQQAQVAGAQRQAQVAGSVAAADASMPYLGPAQDALFLAEEVGNLGRVTNRTSTDQAALFDDLKQTSYELMMTWKREVYGEAEPPPGVLEDMQAMWRDPGTLLENRERTVRHYYMMHEELNRKGMYEAAKARGDVEAMQRLNYGRLTLRERRAILAGEDVPEGLQFVEKG